MKELTRGIAFIALLLAGVAAFATENEDPWRKSYSLEANGKYAAAAAVIEPMASRGEDAEFAILRLGWLHYLAGEFNDSIRAYRTALEHNPRSIDARLGIALPLMAQQRWREAMRYLKQVTDDSPFHYLANLRLLACEEGLRQWEHLAAHAQSLHERYPADATILVYLARARAWQGKHDLARQAYRSVLHRAPGNLEARRYLNQ